MVRLGDLSCRILGLSLTQSIPIRFQRINMRDKIKVLITNQKGGVGKSTISANLAGFLAIQKNQKVSLIDFDKQGTSSTLISKNPHANIQPYNAGLSYQQNSNYTMLEAKASLRRYEAHAEITIADLTWTFGLPYEFMLEFDVIIVPSSNSNVEIASTEIFILEYVQRQMVRLRQKQQIILVAPSRIDRNQVNEIRFPGLEFLDNCFVCPPIYRISQINNEILQDFWFRIDNGIISENMIEFGDFVYEKIADVKTRKAETPMVLQPRPPIYQTNLIQSPAASQEFALSREIKPAPGKLAQKEFSFIPSFLRKK